jgi:hypothetical protein
MQLIIKPMGVVLLLSAFLTLTVVIVLLSRETRQQPNGSAFAQKHRGASSTKDQNLLPVTGWEHSNTLTGVIGGQPERVSLTDLPGKKAVTGFRVTRKQMAAESWMVSLGRTIDATIPQNSPMTLRFWARTTGTSEIPVSGSFFVTLQRREAPFARVFYQEIKVGPEWKEYVVTGRGIGYSFAPNEACVDFHMGKAQGVIEIADVRLTAL